MTHRQALLFLCGLILFGFALRIYRIDAVSFRGDEAFTVLHWVSRPLLETLRSEIPLADPQPPLAFALFRGWSLLFGTGEFVMRMLPALLNTLGIAVMYVMGLRLGGRVMGVLAALLWAMHPFLVWHAQDTKAYAVWVVMSAAALWLGLRALDRRRPLDWLLYVVAAVGAAYLYYLELFALVALNVYVLVRYWRQVAVWRRWFLGQAVIAFCLAPWFLQGRLLFESGYSGTAFPLDEWGRVFTWLVPSLNFGVLTLPAGFWDGVWWLVFGGLLFGFVGWWVVDRSGALLLGLSGFLPVVLLGLVSLRLNVFAPRYVLSVVPAYILLILVGVKLSARRLRLLALVCLLGGWLLVSGFSLYNYYFVIDYAKANDWRGLSDYLHAHVAPNDLVIQAAADEAFTLYYGDFSDSERIPANPRQAEAEIIGILEQAQTAYRSIWLVARTPGDWPNAAIAPGWLHDNMQQVRSLQIGDLPVQQFMPREVRPDEIEAAGLAVYSDVAELVDGEVSFEPTGDLIGRLYWRALDTTDQPLKVFVHLAGSVNPETGTPLWSQDDDYLPNDYTNTTVWSPNTIYRGTFRLSLVDIPPGQYQLLVGLYHPQTNQRLAVNDGSDSYTMMTLTLPPPDTR